MKYTVKFIDEAGNILFESEMEEGTLPVAPNATTPQNTAEYTYTGAWDKEIVSVTGEATYTWVVTATKNEYVIKFVDADGEVLQENTLVYGAMPEYTGKTPEKADDEEYRYTFDGWDYTIASVTGEATYTAKYAKTALYEVAFENATMDSVKVAEGEALSVSAPTMAGYQFKGWLKDGVAYDMTAPVTAPITLVASWYKVGKGSQEISVYTFTSAEDLTTDGAVMLDNEGKYDWSKLVVQTQTEGVNDYYITFPCLDYNSLGSVTFKLGYNQYSATVKVDGDETATPIAMLKDSYVTITISGGQVYSDDTGFGAKINLSDNVLNGTVGLKLLVSRTETNLYATYYISDMVCYAKDYMAELNTVASELKNDGSQEDFDKVAEYYAAMEDLTAYEQENFVESEKVTAAKETLGATAYTVYQFTTIDGISYNGSGYNFEDTEAIGKLGEGSCVFNIQKSGVSEYYVTLPAMNYANYAVVKFACYYNYAGAKISVDGKQCVASNTANAIYNMEIVTKDGASKLLCNGTELGALTADVANGKAGLRIDIVKTGTDTYAGFRISALTAAYKYQYVYKFMSVGAFETNASGWNFYGDGSGMEEGWAKFNLQDDKNTDNIYYVSFPTFNFAEYGKVSFTLAVNYANNKFAIGDTEIVSATVANQAYAIDVITENGETWVYVDNVKTVQLSGNVANGTERFELNVTTGGRSANPYLGLTLSPMTVI